MKHSEPFPKSLNTYVEVFVAAEEAGHEGLLVVSRGAVPYLVVGDHYNHIDPGSWDFHVVAEAHRSHLAVAVVVAGGMVARFHNPQEVHHIRDRCIPHDHRNIHNPHNHNPDVLDRNIHHTPGLVPGPAILPPEEVACGCRTVSEGEDLADMAVAAGRP